MSLFDGSQNTTITGGNFINQPIYHNTSVTNGQTGINILLKASNRDAAHDSSAREYDPRCHPGTREQHIEDIVYWAVPASGADVPLPLFWMKGPAGVGKSAIAQTCAERLKGLGRLGATFFFSLNGRDKAAEFIPTIAYQLSTQFPDYRVLVDQRICHDNAILDKTIAVQFEALIVEPFQKLEEIGKGIGKRIVIIIDGLDECDSVDAQCKIIELIAGAARNGATPFCWAFFSRPEPHIRASFAHADVVRVTCITLLPISNGTDSDIELYLRNGFENILRRRDIRTKSQWPSDNDIQTLVKASNGLFIYAATALRDVDQAGSLEEALRAVCASTPNLTDKPPFAGLDAFYMVIMRRIPPKALPTVLLLCTQLCNDRAYAGGDQSGVMLWGNFLTQSEIEFRAVCNHLSAVLHIRDHNDSFDLTQFNGTNRPFQHANRAAIEELRNHTYNKLGGSIYFYHKSFYDFIIDPTRSGTFCLGSPPMINALYKHSLEVVLKYEESYSFRGSELGLAHGVPDSASSLSWPSTNELVNSMLKALVYDWAFDTCFIHGDLPEIECQLLQRFGRVDFRKVQRNWVMLYAGLDGVLGTTRWNCRGGLKITPGAQLFHVPQDQFRTWFNVIKFKVTIKRWKECGIIQSYYPNFTSRFKSLVSKKSQGKPISGLYRLGHSSKSAFWYWEIDFKEEYYQEFLAADLVEGGRAYREEQFHLWPKESWEY
ncbi:hypothetical protein P691DRAFT_730472 [Macrolepiota fuliginosa MF-IS2]|uniref:Nephrocystin 3-like N-terminal domain-containing protein n=1 Tax=Macrolepiota fuliginosa MF-IS2 TaxID=1400762 RepID=A0A9P5XD93_9AGAR|nr:hypothetical protein P691DRAFT_730472 [Macrolepiota fuliginosa MF-IS2]